MSKKWELLCKKGLNKKSVKEILKILFKNRGLDWDRRKEFFNPTSPLKLQPEDVGLDQKRLDQAKGLIEKQGKKDKIVIFGDYDVDGLTATAILWRALYKNYNVVPFIPDREEDGYGIKVKTVDKLIKRYPDLSLIVTVDNGIVANKAIDYAKKKGIAVLLTDHHMVQDSVPKADVVLHSTNVAGCVVAWFLAKQFGYTELALPAIGTVGDLLPLVGPNRSFVKHGLRSLANPKEVGLKQLKKIAGIKRGEILPWQISFVLGPRLNAAGRLGDPLVALRLLCTSNTQQAQELAVELNRLNQKRQNLTAKGLELASKSDWGQKKLLITVSKDYHQGIIGLIAGKLTEEFHRPSIAIWQGEKISKGSARSVDGCNIVQLIKQAEDLLESLGGHELAAGFSVKTENIVKLEKRLLEIADKQITDILPEKKLQIDCPFEFSLIEKSVYDQIQKMGPFGMGNPKPVFCLTNARIVDIQTMGGSNQHLKMFLDDPQTPKIERVEAEVVGFGYGKWIEKIFPGDLVDVVFNLNLNRWNGKETLQLKIKDLRKAK